MSGRGADSGGEAETANGQQPRSPEKRSSRHFSDPPESSAPVYRDPEAFASWYPVLDRQLRRSLVRRGLDADTARDISQEAWVRLFKHTPPLADRRAVARWVSLVGYRLAEEWQSANKRSTCEPVPDRVLFDVADEVVAWLNLHEVFNDLAPADRDALLAAADDVPRGKTKRERDSMSLRVHRARRRFHARLRDGWAALPLRWLSRQRGDSLTIESGLRLIGFAAFTALSGVSVVVGGWPSSPPATAQQPPVYIQARLEAGHGASAATSAGPVQPPKPADVGAPRPSVVPTSAPSPSPRRLTQLVVGDPGQPQAVVGEDRRQDEHELLCYGNIPVVGGRCFYTPSSGDPASMVGK